LEGAFIFPNGLWVWLEVESSVQFFCAFSWVGKYLKFGILQVSLGWRDSMAACMIYRKMMGPCCHPVVLLFCSQSHTFFLQVSVASNIYILCYWHALPTHRYSTYLLVLYRMASVHSGNHCQYVQLHIYMLHCTC